MTTSITMFSKIMNTVRNKEVTSHVEKDKVNHKGHLPERNAYHRPAFLELDKSGEEKSLDIQNRPIQTTTKENGIPLGAGYAECINGGKSSKNEDQAAVGRFRIPCLPNGCHRDSETVDVLDVHYFAIFDGHAGPGAALMAADQLIIHLQEKFVDVHEEIFNLLKPNSDSKSPRKFRSSYDITLDDLVIGALEGAFISFDEQIARERTSFSISGGCAAVVAITLQEKLYVAHAGDCRAVAFIGDDVKEMAIEFTPETDSQRIQSLAHMNPSLIQDIFSDKLFERNINKSDLGTKVLYKAPNHRGWQSMTVTEAELSKSPLVIGQGKWAKLMGIIGVARGFGDHDLIVPNSSIKVKPFLTPFPEVRVLNLAGYALHPNDVLVMGCDGLWDFLSNDQIKKAVRESLATSESETTLPNYHQAAGCVVNLARGDNNGRGWKMADGSDGSFDDICAFVIPLHATKQKKKEQESTSIQSS